MCPLPQRGLRHLLPSDLWCRRRARFRRRSNHRLVSCSQQMVQVVRKRSPTAVLSSPPDLGLRLFPLDPGFRLTNDSGGGQHPSSISPQRQGQSEVAAAAAAAANAAMLTAVPASRAAEKTLSLEPQFLHSEEEIQVQLKARERKACLFPPLHLHQHILVLSHLHPRHHLHSQMSPRQRALPGAAGRLRK